MLDKINLIMKRQFGLMIIVATVIFASCSEEVDSLEPVVFEDDVSTAATADALFDDIDDVTEIGMEELEAPAMKTLPPDRGRIGDCAEVTVDREAGTVVIDFGDGCIGSDGRLRKGIIRITHSGEFGQFGHIRVTTFEDFEIDSIGVEGTRTVENITPEENTERVISITLVDGKLSFPDGTSITREAEKIRTTAYNVNDNAFQSTVYGQARGVNRDALQYTHTVDAETPLLFTRACREMRRVAAVSGILLIEVEGESDKTVDFGDGTCDNLVTVTQDGVTTEIEIDPKQTRRRHHRRR